MNADNEAAMMIFVFEFAALLFEASVVVLDTEVGELVEGVEDDEEVEEVEGIDEAYSM